LFLLGQGRNAPASEGGSALTGVGFIFAFPTPEHVRVDAKVFSGLVDALGLGEFDGLGFVLLIVKFSGHVSLHCGAELFVHKILPTSTASSMIRVRSEHRCTPEQSVQPLEWHQVSVLLQGVDVRTRLPRVLRVSSVCGCYQRLMLTCSVTCVGVVFALVELQEDSGACDDSSVVRAGSGDLFEGVAVGVGELDGVFFSSGCSCFHAFRLTCDLHCGHALDPR
jgi:hypothetical protein